MLIAWLLNVLALMFGAGLGARALIDPRWAARFVRLAPDEQGGGFAEFRATYGGVFLGLHAAALLLALRYLLSGGALIGVAAAGASAALAAGWAGSAFGRAVAIWRDGADTRFNRLSVVVEAGIALAIAAPWIAWLVS
ncbi:MAG TPA: hypothetical protein VEA80_07055 [Vitreimonas sp.]|uniref:hypothetical protein n=1 Tax=Vitreimonas sp. TaxID=3069702 RepID=UPI002D46951D|nr:hypothetical protein [Vitreimonas sp.]HYD87214.1 hypothetical protein [Vitreimonas sp.]